MHLFKSGSRNVFRNQQQERKFKKNYEKLFGLKLPHPDTVDRVMRCLPEAALEKLKDRMVRALLSKKSLHPYRYMGKWFTVAIDGTGVVSFDYKHSDQCLHLTSKCGKTTYFYNVLEAKLVTPSGFSISLVTEWIENPAHEYDKQDCERKAFVRIAKKLKQKYPRLPICLLVDGLYPYQGFFNTCSNNDWKYIATFKDGCLSSVWQEVKELLPLSLNNHHQQNTHPTKHTTISQNFSWVNEIDYNGTQLHWIECLETKTDQDGKAKETRFAQITNIAPSSHTIAGLISTGRMRWKIENEGFNQQKNGGYKMQHKYARKSYLALKNYYQCLQIAHMINQLMVLSTTFQRQLKGKMTLKHLWICLIGELMWGEIDQVEITRLATLKIQVRFVA